MMTTTCHDAGSIWSRPVLLVPRLVVLLNMPEAARAQVDTALKAEFARPFQLLLLVWVPQLQLACMNRTRPRKMERRRAKGKVVSDAILVLAAGPLQRCILTLPGTLQA